MYICVVLKTTLLQILSFHYTPQSIFYCFRCFYKTIVFRLMTDVALTPCWNGLDTYKIGFDPQKIGVKGSMTPKFQSLNWALVWVICPWMCKNCWIWLCLHRSIYKCRPISNKQSQYIWQWVLGWVRLWVRSESNIWSYLPLNKETLFNLTVYNLASTE